MILRTWRAIHKNKNAQTISLRSIKFPDKYVCAGFVVMAGLLLVYFSPYLLHLNDTLFAATGDGMKNFYTLAYYVKYDKGLWFTGMLYPYGEHISFTDNQPLVAMALNFIQQKVFNISPYLLGIVNGLVFLNFFVCAWLLYKILRQLNLPGGYSMACAVMITFVSPNFSRISGHYSLCYCFLIPLIILLVLRYEAVAANRKRWIAVALLLISFLSGLLHPYWVLIIGMLLTVYALVKGVGERKISVGLLLAGMGGPLLFKIFLLFTDPVSDRPQDPFGAAEYAAWVTSIFFPQFDFYDGLRNMLRIQKAEFEAIAYVGIPGIAFAFFLLVKLIAGSIRKRKLHLHVLPGPRVLKYFFHAGILILLFSMFIPFRFGMEELYYRIPFLNQFRSLGRFAWAFYFIFGIYTAYGIWIIMRRVRISKGTKMFSAGMVLLFALWLTDVHFTFSKAKAYIAQYGGSNMLEDNRKIAELLATTDYLPSDFQAVFPLPIVADGTEKLWFTGGWVSKWASLPYSYQSGTPILGGILSRTSLSRTLNFINLTGSDYSEKTIVQDFKSEKPILVASKPHDEASQILLKRCREIARNDELALYLLPLDSLIKVKTFERSFPSSVRQNFVFQDNYYVNDSTKEIVYWTNKTMEEDIAGLVSKLETFDVKKLELDITEVNDPYFLSCWVKITPFGNKVPYFTITEFDSTGKKLREKETGNSHIDNYDVYESWIRLEDTVHLNPLTRKVELEILGKKSIVDHFLFRPENAAVVVIPAIPGKIYFNNFFAKTESLP